MNRGLMQIDTSCIPEDDAAQDEVESIAQARAEYERGETVRLADLRLV